MTERQSIAVAVLAMAAVFAVGVALGIALDHRVLHQHPPRDAFMVERRAGRGGPFVMPWAIRGRRPPPNVGRPGTERALDAFARELDLTPDQLTVADSILHHEFETMNEIRDATWPKMQAVMNDTRRKLDSILSPAQRERYRAMLAEQERRFRPRDGERAPFPSHSR